MNNYLGKYENDAAIQLAVDTSELLKPYVAYNQSASTIDWNTKEQENHKRYFTIRFLADTPHFRLEGMNDAYYSFDNGSTWTLVGSPKDLSLQSGSTVLLKRTSSNALSGRKIETNGKPFEVFGNAASLFNGDDFETVTSSSTLMASGMSNFLYNCNVIRANNLILPWGTIGAGAFDYMFAACVNLQSAPALPATTLGANCYRRMFQGCTSLTTAPTLPATTLEYRCYLEMFSGCTSLTTAPTLPATTLTQDCYSNMFYGCTSLTTAPTLPATTLAQGCYLNMFSNCSNLSVITCLAENKSATNCTTNWVRGVASSGTFTKSPNITTSTWGSGNSGIPSNWTVVDYQG